jgi:hypothetical protein
MIWTKRTSGCRQREDGGKDDKHEFFPI